MPSNSYQRYITDEQRKRKMKRLIWQLSLGIIFILLAIILLFLFDSLFNKLVLSKLKLAPNSEGYANWLNPPIETVRKYHLFNISNPVDIETDPRYATIKFTDTRAYPYSIVTKKNDVKWSDDMKSLYYGVERFYERHSTFDPSSVNDTGIFVNMLRGSLRSNYDLNPSDTLDTLAGKDKTTFTRANPVEQLEGFISDSFKTIKTNMYGPNREKSGLIYRQNGSELYNVLIKTDTPIKGEILNFTSQLVPLSITNLNYSFPIYDGLTYPTSWTKNKTLNIFNADFCQPVLIKYKQSEFNKFPGLEIYQYELKLIDYNNCTDPTDPLTCQEVEKIDVSKCISKSLESDTIYLSKAHFYGANNETIKKMNVEGYDPSEEKHDSFLYFEPRTGTPFLADFRLQVNINVKIDKMKLEDGELVRSKSGRAGKRLVPVFWIDQNIKISPAVIDRLSKVYNLRPKLKYLIVSLVLALAAIIIIVIEIIGRRNDRHIRNMHGGYMRAQS